MADKPVAPDNPLQVDTPAPSSDEQMLSDLTGEVQTPAAPEAGAEKNPVAGEGPPAAPEADEAKLILMREDYLKHKEKLTSRQKELDLEKAALEADKAALEAQKLAAQRQLPPDPAKALKLSFDPEKDFDAGSEGQLLAKDLHMAVSAIQRQEQEIAALKAEMGARQGREQYTEAQYIVSVLDGAVEALSKDPMLEGLSITAEDVGEALLSQGESLAKKYGALTKEMGIEAWKKENYGLLLSAAEKRGGAKPEPPKAPITAGVGGGAPRLNSARMSDDDQMLADLKLGLAD